MKTKLIVVWIALTCLGATCDPKAGETIGKLAAEREANRGRVLFVSTRDGNREIYKVRPDGTDAVRLTDTPADEAWPCFTTERSRVAFVRGNRIYTMWADGTDEREILKTGADTVDALACSPDGVHIAYARSVNGNYDIYVATAAGEGTVRVTDDPAIDTAPTWSPDGLSLAFQSERGGQRHIWIVGKDGTGLRPLTSGGAQDTSPNWGRNDRVVFWRKDPKGQDAFVSVKADGSDTQEHPTGRLGTNPAWSPDGTRFLFDSQHEGLRELFMWSPGGTQRFFTAGARGDNQQPSWTPDPYKAPDKVR